MPYRPAQRRAEALSAGAPADIVRVGASVSGLVVYLFEIVTNLNDLKKMIHPHSLKTLLRPTLTQPPRESASAA